MNEPIRDLLAAAVDRRAGECARGTSFADAHRSRVLRSIRARRAVAYAGTGTAATALAVGAGFGVKALAQAPLAIPPITLAAAPSGAPAPADLATPVATTLVQVPYDYSYGPGLNDWIYVYYASSGATGTVPFPASGLYYPGISDVPSDAVIVVLHGNADGYDLVAQHMESDIGAFPAWVEFGDNAIGGDLVGDRSSYNFQYTADGQNASITWDVVGDVSSTTRWGIHYFLVDGNIVTEVEGRANPDAIEVTAMFDPATFTPLP